MAWLAGWSHRKTVTITGQSGAGTNYQVNLSIGDASGGDFYLENHCTSFPNDITVTGNDQTTLLDHWVEDLTVDPISMWVKVADTLDSNADVCVYYDKLGESSASNIGNTGLFGDDFPGSSIDTGKWDGKTSTAAVSGGILSYGGDDSFDRMTSITQFGSTVASRTKIKYCIPASYAEAHGFENPAASHLSWGYVSDTPTNYWYSKDGTTITTVTTNIPLNMWFIGDIFILGGVSSAWFYDGVEGTNSPKTTNPANTNDLEVIFIGKKDTSIQADWVFIRKYLSPTEPAFSSAGSEESVPTGAIMNQFQGANLGADLFDGMLVC